MLNIPCAGVNLHSACAEKRTNHLGTSGFGTWAPALNSVSEFGCVSLYPPYNLNSPDVRKRSLQSRQRLVRSSLQRPASGFAEAATVAPPPRTFVAPAPLDILAGPAQRSLPHFPGPGFCFHLLSSPVVFDRVAGITPDVQKRRPQPRAWTRVRV